MSEQTPQATETDAETFLALKKGWYWVAKQSYTTFEAACLLAGMDPRSLEAAFDAETGNCDTQGYDPSSSTPEEAPRVQIVMGRFQTPFDQYYSLLKNAIRAGELATEPARQVQGAISGKDLTAWVTHHNIPDESGIFSTGHPNAVIRKLQEQIPMLGPLIAAYNEFWLDLKEDEKGEKSENIIAWLQSEFQLEKATAARIDKLIRPTRIKTRGRPRNT